MLAVQFAAREIPIQVFQFAAPANAVLLVILQSLLQLRELVCSVEHGYFFHGTFGTCWMWDR